MARRDRDPTILHVFRDELDEGAAQMVDALLRVEANPESAAEPIREILRIAHGLKGAAFAAGLPRTARFVHDVETSVGSLIDSDRLGDASALQALYEAFDALAPHAAGEANDRDDVIRKPVAAHVSLAGTFGLELEDLSEPEPVVGSDGASGQAMDQGGSVRVAVGKLDRVLESASELAASRTAWAERANRAERMTEASTTLLGRLTELARQPRERESSHDRATAARRVVEECLEVARRLAADALAFEDEIRVGRQVDQGVLGRLQDDVRAMRLVPVGLAFASFARLVRDVSAEADRKVDLVVEGAETEVDRDLLETVREAVAHVLRNAVAHGIEAPAARVASGKSERGRVVVTASTHGRRARVEISDDGGGIDLEAVGRRAVALGLVDPEALPTLDDAARLELLFAPGFSTAESVSTYAGRGVGLDAVRTTAARLGGNVSVSTELGRGTRFVLELPVSRAAVELLLVESGGERFALPAASLVRILRVGRGNVAKADRGLALEVDGRPVRVFALADLLGGQSAPLDEIQRPTLLVRGHDGDVALVVDRVIDHRQCLTKSLGDHLEGLELVQGATVLADGEVVPVLDGEGLVSSAIRGSIDVRVVEDDRANRVKTRVLVVDDSITTRTLQKGILEAAGYEVVVATNGVEALERLAGGRIALVLSDVEMPKMDGIELATRIKSNEKTAKLPVVIVSSLGRAEDRERGLRAGADAYVVKGEFEQGALLETLRRLLG